MNDFHSSSIDTYAHNCIEQALFGQPDDVLKDARLSTPEKRRLLASWASDANAIPHLPALRQLPDGSIVRVGEILDALKALGNAPDGDRSRHNCAIEWRQAFKRRGRAPGHVTAAGRGMTTTRPPARRSLLGYRETAGAGQ